MSKETVQKKLQTKANRKAQGTEEQEDGGTNREAAPEDDAGSGAVDISGTTDDSS